VYRETPKDILQKAYNLSLGGRGSASTPLATALWQKLPCKAQLREGDAEEVNIRRGETTLEDGWK